MERLTALIVAKNEEQNLENCLASVQWADEVLLADSGSTDQTMDLARRRGARVIQRPWITEPSMRNWAIQSAMHPWVLTVDADERVSAELREEIRALLQEGPRHLAYRIYRQNYFFGHRIAHCGWEKDDVIRLYRKDKVHYPDRLVHMDAVIEGGDVGVLKGKLLHYTYWTFDQYFRKFDRYTTFSAQDLRRRRARATFFALCLRPWWRIVKMYLLRRGFLDGRPGLILCGLAACSVFVKYAKLWALEHTNWGVNREWTDGWKLLPPDPQQALEGKLVSGIEDLPAEK